MNQARTTLSLVQASYVRSIQKIQAVVVVQMEMEEMAMEQIEEGMEVEVTRLISLIP